MLVDAGILTLEEMQEEKRKILADNNSVDVIQSNPQTIIRCSACGEEADAELAECPHCHEPLSGKSMEVENTTKPCVVCGEPILSIAEKCKHCGAWQNEAVEEIAPDAVPLTIGSDGHISFERPEEAKTPLEEEKKSDGVNMKTVLIALAVMAIIIIVLLLSKKSNEPSYYDEPQEEVVAVDSAVADAETYYDEGTLDSIRLMREDAEEDNDVSSQTEVMSDADERQIGEFWNIGYFTNEFGEEDHNRPFVWNDWVGNNYTKLYQRFYVDSKGVPGLIINIYSNDRDLYKVEGPANFAVKAGNGEVYNCDADDVFDGHIVFHGDKAMQIGRIYEMNDLKISLEVELYLERKRYTYSAANQTHGLGAELRRLAKKYE